MTTRQKYREAGVESWRDHGFASLEKCVAWRDAGFDAKEAVRWRDGFTQHCGVKPEQAAIYRTLGMTPDQALAEEQRLARRNQQPATAKNPKGAGPPRRYAVEHEMRRFAMRCTEAEYNLLKDGTLDGRDMTRACLDAREAKLADVGAVEHYNETYNPVALVVD